MKWEKQEAGWYISEAGGIVKEKSGWFFYSKDKYSTKGPFKTLKEAKESVK